MATHENRQKALTLLKALRITEAPVDVNKIAKYLGFMVIPYDFPEGVKGMMTVEEDNSIKAIGVNKSHPEYLQRYTIAHELGHYLNGHKHIDKEFIDDDTKYYDSGFQQEKEADRFAAELLMPVEYLEQDLKQWGIDIKKLTEKYKVSEQALWIRLTTLRLAEKYASSS